MAKANVTHSEKVATLIASDLTIRVSPRAYTTFQGTAAQLIAEGLIPDGFKWPSGAQRVTIELDGFKHWIFRTRPEGHKGPMSSWVNGDCWYLRREPKRRASDGDREADIYAKKMELADIIYRGTPEWSRMWDKAYRARKDEKYMAFRTQILGEMAPRKRGRTAKSVSAAQLPIAQ